MVLLKIKKYGSPILSTVSENVDVIDKKVKKLISNMIHTMTKSHGIGLAANQVGINKRIFVMGPFAENERPMVLINPEVIESEGSAQIEEGCLSIPGVFEKVKRFAKIKYSYTDIDGNSHIEIANGLKAIVFQHEFDHLNGICFIDRLDKSVSEKIKNQINT